MPVLFGGFYWDRVVKALAKAARNRIGPVVTEGLRFSTSATSQAGVGAATAAEASERSYRMGPCAAHPWLNRRQGCGTLGFQELTPFFIDIHVFPEPCPDITGYVVG
jgi:hypothetical protein